jgi:hypothetical protein
MLWTTKDAYAAWYCRVTRDDGVTADMQALTLLFSQHVTGARSTPAITRAEELLAGVVQMDGRCFVEVMQQ